MGMTYIGMIHNNKMIGIFLYRVVHIAILSSE